ncbi:cyclic nucleotide-binding domain-containing protein [Streptomyces sp. ODS28]|uniref:Crp/Fnr family transcriptional regulator n=1 Tax=Streptomyces sp. ODS28 TaxID=3136688 RepID=UPI0031EA794F
MFGAAALFGWSAAGLPALHDHAGAARPRSPPHSRSGRTPEATTTTYSPTRINASLPADHRARLLETARDVNFDGGTRLFDEGAPAEHFWIVRSGAVTLDIRTPDGGMVVIDTLGQGELVGWSWLFPPYTWQLGAEAMTPVRTSEFEAATVRRLMDEDPRLGAAVNHWVGWVLAHRLNAARSRLLNMYGPHGRGRIV